MSLHKYMHPRNKYRKIPDFKQLALLYPEFRKIAITDLAGKIHIDFKNEESLRVLTEVLLKHDFNLTVKIPKNKLVPTLPLRLNYVLWIEDLMKHASFVDMELVKGIDIGTGAVGIYPLLFAKIYKSHMIGTDIDDSSVQSARNNIEENNLQDLITVAAVSGETVLKDIVGKDQTYHFTMCNPPFFETDGDSIKTIKRLPPRNAPTGKETELMIPGGERTFITRLIEESVDIGDKIKIYTTMIGRKSNLLFLIKQCKKKKIQSMTWTEFCQGHTKRWGMAWTYLSKNALDLTKAPVIRKCGDFISKLLKDHPTEIILPIEDRFSSLADIITFLKVWTSELNIQIREFDVQNEDFNCWGCKLTAEMDSWSYARKRRRLAQRLSSQHKKLDVKYTDDNSKSVTTFDTKVTTNCNINIKNKDLPEGVPISTKKLDYTEPFLVCSLFIELGDYEEGCEEKSFKICMSFERGSGGKNALETFKQYLINKFDIREHHQKQCSKRNPRSSQKVKKIKKDFCIPENDNIVQTQSEHSSNEHTTETT